MVDEPADVGGPRGVDDPPFVELHHVKVGDIVLSGGRQTPVCLRLIDNFTEVFVDKGSLQIFSGDK